jgi:hypothetical protein
MDGAWTEQGRKAALGAFLPKAEMTSTKIGTEADFCANSASIACALPYSDAAFRYMALNRRYL